MNYGPSTEEWVRKMQSRYVKKYYLAIKSNNIGSFVEMWMNLESVIQSEMSQKEKNRYCTLMHTCGI